MRGRNRARREPEWWDDPMDLRTARRMGAQLTAERREVAERLKDAIEKKAAAEEAYRTALAKRLVSKRAEFPATLCADLARGEADIARLKAERDIAEGMVDVWQEELRLCDQRRATYHRDVEWSMKVAPHGDGELSGTTRDGSAAPRPS